VVGLNEAFQFPDPVQELWQPREQILRTKKNLVRHGRNRPGHDRAIGNVPVYTYSGGQDDSVADRNVILDTSLASNESVAPNGRTARDANLRCDNGSISNLNIVSDLDQIVQLHTLAQPRDTGKSTVDGNQRTNFHVITNLYASSVVFLDIDRNTIFIRISGITETVGANDRTSVDYDPVANSDTRIDGHIWEDPGFIADLAAIAYDGVRADHGLVTYNRSSADHGKRPD
jgi:hypothetical protein